MEFLESAVFGLEYLDLSVDVSLDRVRISPALSNLPSPLHVESGQARHVHLSWPKVLARRIIALGGNSSSITKLADN